jgi:hypothetical protein
MHASLSGRLAPERSGCAEIVELPAAADKSRRRAIEFSTASRAIAQGCGFLCFGRRCL